MCCTSSVLYVFVLTFSVFVDFIRACNVFYKMVFVHENITFKHRVAVLVTGHV